MSDVTDLLGDLPHEERIRSRRLNDRTATLIVDATGLSGAERSEV